VPDRSVQQPSAIMKHLPLILVASLLAAPLTAQQYDYNGDPVGGDVGGGPNVPGTILKTITCGSARYNDIAHDGEYLLALDGTTAVVQVIDDVTGFTVATIPVVASDEYGLAWDDKRELLVTTNASSDVVNTYTRAGVLVNSWPFPSTGFVGATWDCRRDVYWIVDWSANTLIALDPTTGAPGTVYSTSAFGCTRGAGVAYDANTDTIYVGGRDQKTIFGVTASAGALVCSFLGDQGSTSNPHGLAWSPRGGVWEALYSSGQMHEREACTPTHPWLKILPAFPTAGSPIAMTMSGLIPGERGIFLYSTTGCGPTASPIGDLLLSLPRTVITIRPANGLGVASIGANLPGGLSGRRVYLHGGGLSGSGRCNNAIINP